MSHFLTPTNGTDDWRRLLADPDKHWRTGYSARSLACCWEAAKGFPTEVQAALATSEVPALQAAEILIGIPEHQVALPGGRRPSQNDLWVLARGNGETISIAVEGKVSEPFGPTVGEWLKNASAGKLERLEFLTDCLGLEQPVPGAVRYQLLHRTASAVIEARRFGASHAVLLVHSFSQTHEWLDDYERFLGLFDTKADVGRMATLQPKAAIQLHAVWVRGAERHLSS